MTEESVFGPVPGKYVADFALLLDDPRFLNETDPARQIYIATEILRSKAERVPFPVIGSFFKVSKGTVHKHWQRCRRGSIRLPGRKPTIPTQIKHEMFAHIARQFEQGEPVGYEAILDWLYAQHHLLILPDTLRHCIRKAATLRTVRGVPTDEPRCFVTADQIEAHFHQLSSELQDVPAHFVFNVDESGFQDFVDAREMPVVVPAAFERDQIPIPAKRSEKRATMVATISSDGGFLRPLVIVQRKTYEVDLIESGFTSDKVRIVHRERGFIDRNLFDEWARTIFFPDLQRRRVQFGYAGPVVLILDGCTSHTSDWFLDEALALGVTLHFLPPHSSDKTQPLDLGLFGLTKRALTRVRPDPTKSNQSNQLLRMLCAWFSVATPKNITGSFIRAGIVPWWGAERDALMIRVIRERAELAQQVFLQESEEDQIIQERESDDDLGHPSDEEE